MLTQMISIAEVEAGLTSSRTKAAVGPTKARGQRLGGFRGMCLPTPTVPPAPPPGAAEHKNARPI